VSQSNEVALLVGAGDAIGAAVARRFAIGGYKVCIARRDAAKSSALIEELRAEGFSVHAFDVDARKEAEVENLFARVEDTVGPIAVCLFNAGANVKKPLLETTGTLFFKAWELACFAGFLVGREAAKYMLKRGRGTILFTGATASVRGSNGFSAFSSAKFGLRALAQAAQHPVLADQAGQGGRVGRGGFGRGHQWRVIDRLGAWRGASSSHRRHCRAGSNSAPNCAYSHASETRPCPVWRDDAPGPARRIVA